MPSRALFSHVDTLSFAATEGRPADGRMAVKFDGIPRTYTPQDMHRALKRMGAFKNGDVPLANGKLGLGFNPQSPLYRD
jgi:hypothetical protein